MHLFRKHAILAAGALSFSAYAGAELPSSWTEADDQDVACLIAIASAGTQIAESQKIPVESVGATTTYFVGKVKARHPRLKLATVVTRDYLKRLKIDFPVTLVRCGEELQEAGADMTAMGRALSGASTD